VRHFNILAFACFSAFSALISASWIVSNIFNVDDFIFASDLVTVSDSQYELRDFLGLGDVVAGR
jgi:hypothetical protein